MKLLHLIFGLAVFVVFLLTGQYMRYYYPNMAEVSDGLRLLLRTRHIYILAAGLININLGLYFSYRNSLWRRVMQLTGSALIVIATCLLVFAFFYDTKLPGLDTPYSHYGLYLLLAGTLFHLFGALSRGGDSARA